VGGWGLQALGEGLGQGVPPGPLKGQDQALGQARPRKRKGAKYPTAAFAAVGALEKPFHSPDLGTSCCETKVRALSQRMEAF
jgi:pyruvate dehydrogenase E2 component (dihydrolipoamide acetyltransferase)